MLYSEFVAGTGCRETDKNYQVYKELEIIYMNTDCSKEHIYEMGRKLVDNSKTEAELEFEAEIKRQIKDLKDDIKWYRAKIKSDEDFVKMACTAEDEEYWKADIKWYKKLIAGKRNEIKNLQWVLN